MNTIRVQRTFKLNWSCRAEKTLAAAAECFDACMFWKIFEEFQLFKLKYLWDERLSLNVNYFHHKLNDQA